MAKPKAKPKPKPGITTRYGPQASGRTASTSPVVLTSDGLIVLPGRKIESAATAPVGIWVATPQSSWVYRAMWTGDNFGTLYIQYKDSRGVPTIIARYDRPCSKAMWLSFLNAPSKGTWVHRRDVYFWPFTPVSES